MSESLKDLEFRTDPEAEPVDRDRALARILLRFVRSTAGSNRASSAAGNKTECQSESPNDRPPDPGWVACRRCAAWMRPTASGADELCDSCWRTEHSEAEQ
jgi:hypothetical protein